MEDQEIPTLVGKARTAGRDVEARKLEMLRAAFKRQGSMLPFKAAGLSARRTADLLGLIDLGRFEGKELEHYALNLVSSADGVRSLAR